MKRLFEYSKPPVMPQQLLFGQDTELRALCGNCRWWCDFIPGKDGTCGQHGQKTKSDQTCPFWVKKGKA